DRSASGRRQEAPPGLAPARRHRQHRRARRAPPRRRSRRRLGHRPRSRGRRRGRRDRGRGPARSRRADPGLVHRQIPRGDAVQEWRVQEWPAEERCAHERHEVIFYGWRIVAAAFVVLFTAYGAQYCFGVFFAALLDEFRWSRAGVSGVFSLYAFALPPLAQRLVTVAGWRAAYVVFGVGVLTALALAATVMRRDPRSMGLRPDGDDELARADDAPVLSAWPLRLALRERAFWLIGAAFTATWLAVFIPLVHLVPFARDLGYDAATGAWLLSALGAGAVGGR